MLSQGLLGWTITQMKSTLLPFISNSTITRTSAHSQESLGIRAAN